MLLLYRYKYRDMMPQETLLTFCFQPFLSGSFGLQLEETEAKCLMASGNRKGIKASRYPLPLSPVTPQINPLLARNGEDSL